MNAALPDLGGDAWPLANLIKEKCLLLNIAAPAVGSIEAYKLASMMSAWGEMTVLKATRCK